jgi:hypothetical protein
VVGEGWSSVVVAKFDSTTDLSQVTNSLPRESGSSWGSGWLLTGKAFSAVITDDGRVAAGAVMPAQLYRALAR